jgi:hypothetical protein
MIEPKTKVTDDWPTLGLNPRRLIAVMIAVLVLAWATPMQAQKMDSGTINDTKSTGTIMTVVGGAAGYVGGTILEGTAVGAGIVAAAPVLVILGGAAVVASIIWSNCWLGTCQTK